MSDENEHETLEGCVCGKCTHCPDGYHYRDDQMPCICTPDCIYSEDDDPAYTGEVA
jgi:hypothetical protein